MTLEEIICLLQDNKIHWSLTSTDSGSIAAVVDGHGDMEAHGLDKTPARALAKALIRHILKLKEGQKKS